MPKMNTRGAAVFFETKPAVPILQWRFFSLKPEFFCWSWEREKFTLSVFKQQRNHFELEVADTIKFYSFQLKFVAWNKSRYFL